MLKNGGNCMGGPPFTGTHKPQAFTGRCLHRDVQERNGERICDVRAHPINIGSDAGGVEHDGCIDVNDCETVLREQIPDLLKEDEA